MYESHVGSHLEEVCLLGLPVLEYVDAGAAEWEVD